MEDAAQHAGPPFGQSVGFLLSQLGFEVARRFGDLMSEADLEPRQFALMRAIAAAEGRSQNEVGDTLRIPPSSMVSLIDHLEERGLVERRAHPTDRRSRQLYITAHGKSVLSHATALVMGLEHVVCEGITDNDRQTLVRLLGQVTENLELPHGLHPGTFTSSGRHHWTKEGDKTSEMAPEPGVS